MILDIDHLAISSNDVDKDKKIFQNLGYKILFTKKNVKNLDIKKSLLKSFSSKHDIMLLKLNDNLRIELLNHHSINQIESSIIPIFENSSSEFYYQEEMRPFDGIGYKTKLKNINIPIIVKTEKDIEFRFNKLLFYSSDMDKSSKFLSQLGFKEIKNKKRLRLFEFTSLLSKLQFFIFLKYTENKTNIFLDDFGPNCLALITNSIEREKEKFSKLNYVTTSIQNIFLDEKKLKLFFVRGPSHELIEIIGLEDMKRS